MKTLFYLILLIFNISVLLQAHQEFYKRSLNDPCDVAEVVSTYKTNEIISWMSYFHIPVAKNFTVDFPPEINVYEAESQFNNAVANWNLFSGSELFDLQDNVGDNVWVQFVNNSVIFPMPASQYLYGVTIHKLENIDGIDYIVTTGTECPDYGTNTFVLLNSTSGRQFAWRLDHYIPSISHIDFEYTICHELGHVLGLAHCSYEYPDAMMHAFPPYGDFAYPYPRDKDLEGLSILQTTVGIEDYIWITLDYDHYDIGHPYLGTNHREFFDMYPYDDEIDEWGNWWINALSSCGDVLVYETSENGYIYISSLPNGYNWLRDENGNVLAVIYTSGIDTDGDYHEASMDMKISNAPNNNITSGTLPSDTWWCGDVVVTGNITVPTGTTLTIYPGSIITFANNASLIVNGTLNANGVPFSRITFTSISGATYSSWGSIVFSGSGASGSTLEYANIKYGTRIEANNNASNITIQYCNIDTTYDGVYFNGATGSI